MAFAPINGITLHYRLNGPVDGAPLVLVNSLGTDARIWDEVIALLPHHRVLSYDKRGHGLSDVPPGPYSIDDHVSDLLALADNAGFNRFAIAGISIGGMIALRLAARHPGRVQALVACDTAARIGTATMWDERISAVSSGGMDAVAENVLGRWLSQNYRARRSSDYAGWRNMLLRCPPEGYIASCATVRDTDLGRDLPRIVAPALVLVGADDLPTPPELVRETAQRIPGARFEIIEDAGHVPSLDQPERLAQLLYDHFNEADHG